MFIYPAVLSLCSIKALYRKRELDDAFRTNATSESYQYNFNDQLMLMYRQLTDSHAVIFAMLTAGIVCSLCLVTALLWF